MIETIKQLIDQDVSKADQQTLLKFAADCKVMLHQQVKQIAELKQYEIFNCVVTLGIACGLSTPQEWIANFERSYTNVFAYSDIPVVEQIVWKHVVPALYKNVELCENEPTMEQLQQWVYKEDGQ